MEHKITTPLNKNTVQACHAGDTVLISGEIYTARDAAHKRLVELARQGNPLPFDIKDSIIYYVGPTPAKPGMAIGSAGPTTSYRMDVYSPTLIELGETGMIGKGKRDNNVIEAMKAHKAVYFAAIGGAGALLSQCVKKAEIVAYEDLGAEAIRKLNVENLPAIVVIDCYGNNLYESGRSDYLNMRKSDDVEE